MEAPFEKCSICDSVRFLIEDEEEAIDGYKKADECLKSLDNEELRVEISTLYNHIIGEELEHIKELQDALQKLDPKCAENQGIELHEDLTDEVYEEDEENSDYTDIGDDEEYLGEELKIFTSDLDNFHPSEQCKDLWEDIKDNGKIEDLEYALETLYPDGISDVALDDLLCYEEDWIRDLIDLPVEEDEHQEDSEDEVDEADLDTEDDEDVEPLDFDPEDENDDIEPLELDTEEKEVEKAEEESDEEDLDDKDSESEEFDDEDEHISDIAEGFIKSNFKKNNLNESDDKDLNREINNSMSESDDEDDVVDISDDLIENMMGLPKKGE